MTIYILKLVDTSWAKAGPTALEMMWFVIVALPLIVALLYCRNKIVAKISTEKTFVHNDQLFPVPLNIIEDSEEVEIKKHSILKRCFAMGLIILIIVAPLSI
jgi:hypothetical protein